MVEVPKYPFMARRNGSENFYYKRPVPKALQAEGRPKQIWRSLETDNEALAKVAYRKVDEETDAAGSGKTNTLAVRVASNIRAIAFQTFLDVPLIFQTPSS